jgi:hypothetical protein
VIAIKEVELTEELPRILINGDVITICNAGKEYSYKLDIKDTVEIPAFDLVPCDKPLPMSLHVTQT